MLRFLSCLEVSLQQIVLSYLGRWLLIEDNMGWFLKTISHFLHSSLIVLTPISAMSTKQCSILPEFAQGIYMNIYE